MSNSGSDSSDKEENTNEEEDEISNEERVFKSNLTFAIYVYLYFRKKLKSV